MKLIHGLILGALVIGIFLGYGLRGAPGVGVSFNTPTYNSATNSSATCGATTGIVVGSSTARTSFIVSNRGDEGNVVYLCRAETCSTATGISFASSTERYEQRDQYQGSYSCIAASTTTLTYTTSP